MIHTGGHLNDFGPAPYVVRDAYHLGQIYSVHATSRAAARWIRRERIDNTTVRITRSFTAQIRYTPPDEPDNLRAFPTEFEAQFETYADGMAQLVLWIDYLWSRDYDNHPSRAGRDFADERWLDPQTLAHTAALTTIPTPGFVYNMGHLSPPEGQGNNLRLSVLPTPLVAIQELINV